ncbi:amidohydrolase family protein [Acidisoma cladoniae]|uniref:amidohydrolase family protein n=1 Tax=Acidisoma cladoniae TaxID=3040935 RepID=UPI002550A498|nr:amidohydrolase family protein [Acidisoma sp. PAMC 29798]
MTPNRLVILGAQVWDPEGDVHAPSRRDVLIEGTTIAAVLPPGDALTATWLAAQPAPEVLEATDRLLMPGFVNAHFHSYDGLMKGLLEDMPFDVWALHSQPAYFGKRSRAEIRARTLVGAIECLKHGITTVQDMNSLVPMDEETLDVTLAAFAEVGIRVVFSIALRDVAALDIAPFMAADLPESVRALVEGSPRDPHADLAFVERQIARLAPLPSRLHWALSPSGPQRSSATLLEGIVDMAQRHSLPVTTHVLETPAQRAKAQSLYTAHGGSMIRYMASLGLLGPGTTLAHGVWLDDEEIAMLAESGASVVHNPMSNLKLKSGVAPIRRMHDAGVNLALGCDNCSCGDCQSVFQAMKLFCTLAAVTDPSPAGLHATHAIEAGTLGGARALGLEHVVGAIKPGMRADLCLIDLTDIAWMPLNSVARQLVYSETGRGVETTIVDGVIVMRNRKLTTIDEDQFRAELADVMLGFRRDFAQVTQANAPAVAYLLEANRRVGNAPLGIDRFIRS